MAELMTMEKGTERLDVHPTCVKAHEDAGWKLIGPAKSKAEKGKQPPKEPADDNKPNE